MVLAWVWSINRKDAGVVDIFWGLGFVVVAWVAHQTGDASGARKWLLPMLATLWGLRLSVYLAWRNLVAELHPGNDLGEKEDRRYRLMRRKHGSRFWWVSLITVFGLQGGIMFLVSLPLQLAQTVPGRSALDWHDYVGTLLVLVGIAFEAVGDWQLSAFRGNPGSHGQVLNTGLWRYTRHPNYFGDFLVWWGLWTVASGAGQGALLTVFSPLLMTILLLRVSGVALTERDIEKRRPAYRDYIARTSAFIPWFPKRRAAASDEQPARDESRTRPASAR
ncbi:MAG: DUF1295 domain-containing protein [Alphaproteobacteria bacterium]|nr:DUF1295 domain-containing protein [Alphaproteobacteria bacterium]